MTILALEFSSAQRSVALARDGQVLAAAVETGGFRVTNAFSLITKVLAESHLTRGQIEVLAIGLGPGSYTGIRSAIAVAQGWQLARPVKLLGLSSVEAIAARAHADGLRGRVHVAVDAQRHELYLATWDLSTAGPHPVSPLKIVPSSGLTHHLQAGESLIGPDVDAAGARKIFPDAATLALLAANRADFVPGQNLEPIYLRETSFVKAVPVRGL